LSIRTAPFIITLTGSSGCGKTYITDRIIEFGKQLDAEGIHFKPVRYWKYVTRPYRESEIIDEKIYHKTIDVKSVKTIPDDCEFVYRTYGDEYGFKKKDLEAYLDKGESPIIVINDVRVVEELKKEFFNNVLSLFLFREIIPDVDTQIKIGQSRGGVSKEKIHTRFEKAVELYRIFIENISLFDRTILNVLKKEEDKEDIARIQAEGVIRGVIDGKIPLNKTINKTPKLFIVSGNVQSGKDDIIRAAKKLGKLQTDILLKYTTRWAEDGDDGEIECKFTPKADLIKKYEDEYQDSLKDLEEKYTFETYKITEEVKIREEYSQKNVTMDIETFFRVKYEADKIANHNKIKTGHERFWQELRSTIKASNYTNMDDPDEKEKAYIGIRDYFFEQNPKYIDLENILMENKGLYDKEILEIERRIPSMMENSACLQYKGKPFVLYENNKALPDRKPIYYGYELQKYIEQLKNSNKHIVLTASLPNMFKICREHFGTKNVITAYTYSQISEGEYTKYADEVIAESKLQVYNDILRYAHYIADFDYALIYAETSAGNRSGNQKDALVDQMFRLFRKYNNEHIEKKNKLFVLSGPSAVGKSTIISKIVEDGFCDIAPKYSNRKNRQNVFDDIISVSKSYIDEFCNKVTYKMYGNLYGFNIDEINMGLQKNHLITICSDIDSIKKMKNIFSERFSTIFIYLQDISIENLLKAYIERKNLQFDNNDLFSLAKKLSGYLLTGNRSENLELEDKFLRMIEVHLSTVDYKEFCKRYESLFNSNEEYKKNKDLFNYKISGKTTDELLEKCRKIIENQENIVYERTID
jgi:guanylate kinase